MLYLFQKMLSFLLIILGAFGLTGRFPRNIASYTPKELGRMEEYLSRSRGAVVSLYTDENAPEPVYTERVNDLCRLPERELPAGVGYIRYTAYISFENAGFPMLRVTGAKEAKISIAYNELRAEPCTAFTALKDNVFYKIDVAFPYTEGMDPTFSSKIPYELSVSYPSFGGVPAEDPAPLADIHLRDPFIMTGPDGYYYMTGTYDPVDWSNTKEIHVYRSEDLSDWTDLGAVWNFERDATWQKELLKDGSSPIWAPELHYVNGNYYICYSLGWGAMNGSVLRSTTGRPEGPYEDICGKAIFDAIDSTFFVDDDRTVYAIIGDGRYARMSRDMTRVVSPEGVLRSVSGQPVGFEGCFVKKVGGLYYLCSASYTTHYREDGSSYLSYDSYYAVSSRFQGPYSERRLLLVNGGHGNLFTLKDGRLFTTLFSGELNERPAVVEIKTDADGRLYVNEEDMKMNYGKEYFKNARVGLFTHYTYATYRDGDENAWGGTWYSRDDSRPASSPEEAAAMFDGEAFARTAHDLGAEYVVFTVAHAGFNLLFPSETMKAVCPEKCTEHSDAIAKLIAGLKQYRIPLLLYMPPNDQHDINPADLKRMGWTGDRARMCFLTKLIREIYDRYGTGIAGFWFDQGGPDESVCKVVRACDPEAVIFVNTGVTENTVKHPLSDFIVSEYYGSIQGCDSDTLTTHYSQVNRQIGNWWASGNTAPTDARNLYRYTVRTAATEGQFNAGIAWSCGPYIDQTWETGVRELLSDLGDLLRAHEGIYGTVPGRSYVTQPGVPLEKSEWGVSTESPDGKTVYLHVLNLPENGVLTLPAAADSKTFIKAEYGDTQLELMKNGEGYRIIMPETADPIDTVIRLTAG